MLGRSGFTLSPGLIQYASMSKARKDNLLALAKSIVNQATWQAKPEGSTKNPAAVALGRLGGLRVPNKMPREPRCGQNRSDARKADEAIPRAVWPGGLTRQMGGFRRNPQGRRIFCRMPALLGLNDPPWGRPRPRALACVKIRGVAATGHFVRDSKRRQGKGRQAYGRTTSGDWAKSGIKTMGEEGLGDKNRR